MKDSYYEELEIVFNKFLKYHMKNSLQAFNAKVGREDMLLPIIGKECLHKLVMITELE
jgi:hypothetical protein